MSYPYGSAIPGAVPQLIDIVTAALPDNTTVWLGATLPAYTNPLTFQITKITGTQTPAEIALSFRREETFMVLCQMIAYQGDPAFATILTTLFNAWVPVEEAIAANPTLNNTVRYAQCVNFSLVPDVDRNGKAAWVMNFAVRCEQRVESLASGS